MGQDGALVAPVDLGLGAGDDLEAAVESGQFVRGDAEFGGHPGAGFLQIELDPLVVPGEAVLLHQALVHHRALDQDLRPQPGVDDRCHRVHHLRSTAATWADHGRSHRRLPTQVLRDRPSVQPGLPGDRADAHRAALEQGAKPSKFQPALRIQHHGRCPPPNPPGTTQGSRNTHPTDSTTEHVHPYVAEHENAYADTGPL